MSTTLSSLLSLIFVLALIPAALWFVRRMQGGGAGAAARSGPIRIHASLALGPRERIVILEVAGKSLLVGITAQSMSTLAEFEALPALDEAPAPAFGALLKGLRRP